MDFLIIVVIFAVGGILLYICITPLQKSQMIRDREKAQAEAWAKARLKEVKEKEERQDALARQKSLEDKFFNSPLTRRIIDAISDGTGRRRSLFTMPASPAAPTASPGHMTSLQTEWRPSSAYTTACCITETMSFFCARRSLWEMPLIGYWAENTMFRMRRYAEVSSMPILTEKSIFFFTTPPIMFFCG